MPKRSSKKTQNVALDELSPKQSLAMDALVHGDRFDQAAQKSGVDRNTVSRWFREDPTFICVYRNRRSEIEGAISQKITEQATEAVEVLRELLEADEWRARLSAANSILRHYQNNKPQDQEHHDPLQVANDMAEEDRRRWIFGDQEAAIEFLTEVRDQIPQ